MTNFSAIRNAAAMLFFGTLLLSAPSALKLQASECEGVEEVWVLGGSNISAQSAQEACSSFDCADECERQAECEGYIGEGSPSCHAAYFESPFWWSEGVCYCHDVPDPIPAQGS